MSPPVGATIRPMLGSDVPAMLEVQAQCYEPAMNESAEVLLARHEACPDTAWVALDAQGPVAAYLVAYRSCLGKPTPLGHAFEHVPDADVLYLHDLAIGATLRGQGVAQQMVLHARVQARAMGLRGLALVSVNDTVGFWQRMGFEIAQADAISELALNTYPGHARYMTSL
jgi:ribosomal protein S18 acetylase RimI-like enzyme